MAPIREGNHSYLLKTLDSCILRLLSASPPLPVIAWRGRAWVVRPAPLSNVEIQEERCVNCCYTGVPGSPRTRPAPESRRPQHDTTAPGSAQRRAAGRHWLFTAWVQLLVFRDTVALFQYQHRLWGIFLKNKLPLRRIPSA